MHLKSASRLLMLAAALAAVGAGCAPAIALTIELRDVAADRVERQRAAARGQLPLPGTPNVAMLPDRLKAAGIAAEAPTLIRIFKAESELEIWKQKDGAMVLFATYPICHWSGSLGPKLRSGDKQAPEGFYTVSRAQIHHVGRWPRSLNLGFPNVFDRSQARTGSYILVHGGCSSVGCFAMTNPVMEEIHYLSKASIERGQSHMQVHVFPFRMTDGKMKEAADSPWLPFWSNLKTGYDTFETTKRIPKISVCDGRYVVEPNGDGSSVGPIAACPSTIATIREQDQWLRNVPPPLPGGLGRLRNGGLAMMPSRLGGQGAAAPVARGVRPQSSMQCALTRPSCRKFVALQNGNRLSKRSYAENNRARSRRALR